MISKETYKRIEEIITDSVSKGTDIIYNFDNMTYYMGNSDLLENSIDKQKLQKYILSTKDIVDTYQNKNNSSLYKFVSVLQGHIVNNYSSLNSFLYDNSIQVSSSFAEISNNLGYEIESYNIEN